MKHIFRIMILLLLVTSCYIDEQRPMEEQQKNAISFGAEISQIPVTRVNDSGFCDGDAMGIYVVDYVGDNAGELKSSRNRATNLQYTYIESQDRWQADYDVYFKDSKTPVDIYGYYPIGSPDDVNRYEFSVDQNQSSEGGNGELGGYEASDLLWGKVSKVTPTQSRIMIKFQHIMSCVNVELVEGEGFGSGEWSTLEKSVVVKGLKRSSTIDLSTGEVSVTGEVESTGTVPYRKEDSFRAIVVPQAVAAGVELYSISVGTVPYTFSKSEAFEYVSGKMHKFTIKVNRKGQSGDYGFELIGEAITAWENDEVSHNATMREYIVINSTAGGLREAIIAAGKDFRQLQNLKVTGEINEDDFYFMRDSMDVLACLNLKEVKIERRDYAISESRQYSQVCVIPDQAFVGKNSLTRIVFPDILHLIGWSAFTETSLAGSLIIPDGVRAICDNAFSQCTTLNGELYLPKNLEVIGNSAFYTVGFIGNLNLPDSVEEIGSWAFAWCNGIYGTLQLPSKMSVIEDYTFYGCNFSGDLHIPDNIKVIKDCAFIGVNFGGRLTLSQNLEIIGQRAFESCNFTGSLVLPESLKFIGSGVFRQNAFIGDIVLPEKLEVIGKNAFLYNPMISGIVTIPEGIETLPMNVFAGCPNLEGVILPKSMSYIGTGAFENCFMLNKIVSKADIPPTLAKGSFNGVSKENFTVEVPEKSVKDYAMAAGWSDFNRISSHHELVCRPAFATAINNRTERTLIIDAEGEWMIEQIPQWCSLSQSSGNKKTELTLTIHEMAPGSEIRTGEIVFRLKDVDYTVACSVTQYDYKYKEDEVITLQKATKGNTGGVNLVFLGDGYDAKDVSEGKYLNDVQERVEDFFSIQPYSTYRDYFNVYTAIAVSPQSGVGTVNTVKHNKFESSYTQGVGACIKCGLYSVFKYNLRCDQEAVYKYVLDMNTTVTSSNLNQTLIVLLPNADDFGGSTFIDDNGATISICPRSRNLAPLDNRGVIRYEAGGLGFGKFAEETVGNNAFISECDINWIRYCQSKGWYQNVSITGKMHQTPWSHLIFDERYSDVVDVFEGAYSWSKGVYRSEANSCMNDYEPYYSTICREDIVKRIKQYAGEPYSFEEFVANDNVNKN